MPARKPRTGTGSRRQGATDPDRRDDAMDMRERAIEEAKENEVTGTEEHERRWQPGAHGRQGAHKTAKPGTRSDIEKSGLDRKPREES